MKARIGEKQRGEKTDKIKIKKKTKMRQKLGIVYIYI